MPLTPRTLVLIVLAMIAFAGNSLLCRIALTHTALDPASFTCVRMLSGAIVLWFIVRMRDGEVVSSGSWPSAMALFIYAAAFSFAYVSLSAATGALLLFGAVQATMITYAVWRGERMGRWPIVGLLVAAAGVVALLMPGLTAPSLQGALLMLAAGVAWGIYSLRAKGVGDPTSVTAGNFLRTVPFALVLGIPMFFGQTLDGVGFFYAAISGVVTSAVGYILWYAALNGISAGTAATVQLSVPVIAAVGGIFFLGESVTLRLLASSAAVLGGIALVLWGRQR